MQNPPAGPEDLTKARASDAQRRRATEALSYLIFSTGLVCLRVSDRCVQVPAGVTNGDNVPEKVTMLGASDTTSISIQPRAVAIPAPPAGCRGRVTTTSCFPPPSI